MFRKNPQKVYRHQFERLLKEKGIGRNYELMETIFNEDSRYLLIDTYIEEPKTTVINRLNALWVYPTYLLTIAPVMYILKGNTGINRDSKFGNLIAYLLGEYF